MDFIHFAISNPVKVAVGVMLIILFGLLALFDIPIQLTPNVDQPVITVETDWIGRSPEEIEREIIQEQEDKLRGMEGLRKMTSTAREGQAKIELEFHIGTDLDRALPEVSNKLREVPQYPDDVDEPVVTAADVAAESPMAWLILTSTDPQFDVQGFHDIADKRIKPLLQRVTGVGKVNIYGGREHQVHVQMNPQLMAQRDVTFSDLSQALGNENVNISAGNLPEGRLDVRVRTVGQYDNLEDIRQTIVAYDDGGPVRIRDIGDAVLKLEKRRSFVRSKGRIGLAFQIIRKTGSNVMTAMEGLRQAIDEVNNDILPYYGGHLHLNQVYDETEYIEDAINLVKWSLLIGGALSSMVLLLFLRTLRPTLIVMLAIPVSVIGTFVVMAGAGRNINVISLAGLAFAVGMVVDAAIVVLENIDRHLSMGKTPRDAAFDGAREVWGAILASVLTTVAVFVPVIYMQEEAGQLFRDIAIAICAAVLLSLVVSVSVIPSAASRFLRRHVDKAKQNPLMRAARSLLGLTGVLNEAASAYARAIYWMTQRSALGVLLRVVIVASLTLAALGGSWLLMPPSSYLPTGNRNLVFGIMLNPPGYNLQHAELLADRIEATVRPYWQADSYEDIELLDPVISPMPPFEPIEHLPPIENYFLVSFQGRMFMGAASKDKQNVRPLGGLLTSVMFQIPGSIGFAQQSSIFGRGLGGVNAIDVEVSANDLESLRAAAEDLEIAINALFPQVRVQPDPMNYNLAGPETQLHINRITAADLGVNVQAVGMGVRALVDGANIGDFRYEGETIDLILIRDPDYPFSTDQITSVPIATVDRRTGKRSIVPLAAIISPVYADAPQEIKRIGQRRSIKLIVNRPEDKPMEEVMGQIRDLVQSRRDAGRIGSDVEVRLAGTADKLTQVRTALLGSWTGWNFQTLQSLLTSRMFLALLVTFLLMAALFESFLYPAVIMFSVPLAMVGGFAGLSIVHGIDPLQQLDVLTMLGFVILIGIVVNNAILIVHQALNFMRGVGQSQGQAIIALSPREAIRESVRSRIRPIFMTTATSVCGMLPLVLMPGSGSELYKGLGSVVVGGLMVSTIFTLVVVPLLFSLVLDARMLLFGSQADRFAQNA